MQRAPQPPLSSGAASAPPTLGGRSISQYFCLRPIAMRRRRRILDKFAELQSATVYRLPEHNPLATNSMRHVPALHFESIEASPSPPPALTALSHSGAAPSAA